MKSKKWIWVTLTILLTLVVLVGVAGAGFRMGVMQNANLTRNAGGTAQQFSPFGHMRGFENQRGGDPHMMQGFGRDGDPRMMRGFDRGGFGRGGFFSPLFGLIKLAIFGALIWIVFKLVKNSGWRITREARPAPAASETPAAVVDEKKE